MKLKRVFICVLILLLCIGTVACGKTASGLQPIADPTAKPKSEKTAVAVATPKADHKITTGINLHHAEIVIRDFGTIKLELDEGAAPLTVANFIELSKSGFYDGLTFHRIIKDFMMQGGDPNGNGSGGSGKKLYGEFAENGYDNPISMTRGVIAMGRKSIGYNTASSQFFITQADYSAADGKYAAFGRVTEGMEIVDEICNHTPVTDNNGTVEPGKQPVIVTINIID